MTPGVSSSGTSLDGRVAVLRAIPALANAPTSSLRRAAADSAEERFASGDVVISADDPDDRLFVIITGQAEAAVRGPGGPITLALLGPGDLVGEVAPPGPPSRRDIEVRVTTALLALRLDAPIVRRLVDAHPPAKSLVDISAEDRLEVEFLSSSHFSELRPGDLRALSQRLEGMSLPAGAVVYRAGDEGDVCYIVRAGQIELLREAPDGEPERIATVSAGAVVGEEIALTHGPYGSTARTLTSSDVVVVPRSDLLGIFVVSPPVRDAFLEVFHLRDRPRRVPDILAHDRTDANGLAVTILKDSRRGAYYRLTEHGRFLWDRLDGTRSVQDLTLAYRERFGTFSPALVAGEIAELAAAGFVDRPRLREAAISRPSLWATLQERLRPIMEHRVPLERTAALLDALYRAGGFLVFTRTAQVVLAVLGLAGLAAFFVMGGVEAAAKANVPLWIVIPVALLAIVWHELGHALTAKAFGREVRLGVGWYWFGPLLYVDTTDTWLSGKWPRIAVSAAGPYASIILGSIAALIAALLSGGGSSVDALWLFAGVSYVWALWNLDPLLEYDGYYILADLLDRPGLRRDALGWIGTRMVPAVRRVGLRAFDGHRVELIYGLIALVYVVFIAATTVGAYRLFVESWVATWLPGWIASGLAWVLAAITIAAVAVTVGGHLRTGTRSL